MLFSLMLVVDLIVFDLIVFDKFDLFFYEN